MAKPEQEPKQLAPDLNPWDRQPWESLKAYERFEKWLKSEQRPTFVSLGKLWEITGEAIGAMAGTNLWTQRQTAYDQWEEQEWLKERARLRTASAKRAANIAADFDIAIAQGIKNQLNNPDLTAADLARLTDAATKFKKESFGEPPTQTILTGTNNGPIQIENMTDQDRIAYLEAALQELRKRQGQSETQ